MTVKKCRAGSPLLKIMLFTALFLFSLTPSRAQNRKYVTEQRFIQRLVWVGDEYAFRYEVIIERNEGEGYREFKREFTASSALVISLPLGNYRYCVTPYDYLDQPGEASDWITLEVFAPPAAAGETTDQSASAGSERPFDVMVSAAWAPSLPLHGGMQQIFGQKLYPVGAMLRFGLLYNKLSWFNPGLELSASWYALNKTEDSNEIATQAEATSFNIVAQKWLSNRKMAVTFRAGGGVSFQVGEVNAEYYANSMGNSTPYINLEASFLWLALQQLYLEAGLNYTHFFVQDNSSAYLRPWIGVGLRL